MRVSACAAVTESCKQIGSANMLRAQINTRFELDDVGSDAQRHEGGVPVEALSEGWVDECGPVDQREGVFAEFIPSSSCFLGNLCNYSCDQS